MTVESPLLASWLILGKSTFVVFMSVKGFQTCLLSFRSATRYLQLDHFKVPFALGGSHTLDNLTMRCAAHNQMTARLVGAPEYSGGTGRVFLHERSVVSPLHADDRVLQQLNAPQLPGDRVSEFGISMDSFEDVPLDLEIEPQFVHANDNVEFVSFHGTAGAGFLLAAVEFNGIPLFSPMVLGVFGADYVWRLNTPVPAGLGGNYIVFQGFGIEFGGTPQSTPPRVLVFQ